MIHPFFEELNGIEDEADLIAIVLVVATGEHQAILTAEHRIKGEELTLYDLENVSFQN